MALALGGDPAAHRLLHAAVWMRCHDVGLSGKWALLPPLACLPIAALPFGGLDPLAATLTPASQAWSGLGLCIALILILLAWPARRRTTTGADYTAGPGECDPRASLVQ